MKKVLYENIILNIKNFVGRSLSRKIIVFDCDDWGGIRIPSKRVYDELARKGLPVTTSRYRLDILECRQDLEMLFDVLSSVKDLNGRNAVMTAVTVTANPDFRKIEESGYTEYHYEKFTDTLEKYYPGSDVFSLWREGINAGIFIPELHGRDHITVQLWLEKLREGNRNLRTAFKEGLVSLYVPDVPEPAGEFRAEFFFTSEDQKTYLVNAVREGIKIFNEIFGFSPRVFVPSNNLFHPDFDRVVADEGVRFLYVSHRMPYPVSGGRLRYRYFITNFHGPGELRYYTRNCAFEPTDKSYRGTDLTIKQIEAAFRWKKPAFISTHRANFVSGIDPANRDKGLKELKILLKEIKKRWPDSEFMSSGEALSLLWGETQ